MTYIIILFNVKSCIVMKILDFTTFNIFLPFFLTVQSLPKVWRANYLVLKEKKNKSKKICQKKKIKLGAKP
jgi:hypothetical protein